MSGRFADGNVGIVTGRGGGHQPPEEPYGLSMLNGADGTIRWERSIPRYAAHQNAVWNSDCVTAFAGDEHLTLDASTGKTIQKVSLRQDVFVTRQVDGDYETQRVKQLTRFRKPLTYQSNVPSETITISASSDYLVVDSIPSGKIPAGARSSES